MSCEAIDNLATSIWIDIGEPTGTTVGTIAAQITSAAYLGKLSNLLGPCYTLDSDGAIIPELGNNEQSILAEIYKIAYWGRMVATNAGAGGVRQMVEVSEFDTKVRYASPNEAAKTYVSMQKEAQIALDNLIRSYFDLARGSDIPRSVNYLNFE